MIYEALLSTIYSDDHSFNGIQGGAFVSGVMGWVEANLSILVIVVLGIVKFIWEIRKLKIQKTQKEHDEKLNEINIEKALMDVELREIELQLAKKQLTQTQIQEP